MQAQGPQAGGGGAGVGRGCALMAPAFSGKESEDEGCTAEDLRGERR